VHTSLTAFDLIPDPRLRTDGFYPYAIGDRTGLRVEAALFRAAAAILRFELTMFFVRIQTIRTKNMVLVKTSENGARYVVKLRTGCKR
jgi:hypothetical protein